MRRDVAVCRVSDAVTTHLHYNVVAEDDYLLGAVLNATRVAGEHRQRQPLPQLGGDAIRNGWTVSPSRR